MQSARWWSGWIVALAGCGGGSQPPEPREERAADASTLAPFLAALRQGDVAAALAQTSAGSMLRRALERAAGGAPPAWLAAAAAAGEDGPAPLQLDDAHALAVVRAGSGDLAVVLRREAAGEPWRPAALAELEDAQPLASLAVVGEEFPDSTTRRLLLLLDGLLREALAGERARLDAFVSADALPFARPGAWPAFLAASSAALGRTASITSFRVLAASSATVLAAARIEVAAGGDANDDAAPRLAAHDCLVLYRPISPLVSGTAWGVAWLLEVAGPDAE